MFGVSRYRDISMKDQAFFFITAILLALNIVFLLIGYLLGKINNSHNNFGVQPVSFFKQQQVDKRKESAVMIDDTKYVSTINTSDLEKKYDKLGDIVISNDAINESINKLKNLKK